MENEQVTSVVTEETKAAAAPSPSAEPAKMSEADLWASVDQPAEGQSQTEENPATPVEQETVTDEPEVELDLQLVPDEHDDILKYKPLFKENPELRGIVGRHAAFTEMYPDFQFAKQLHETFPDQESMEQAMNDAGEWQRVSTILTERPEDFPAEYAEANPLGFARMAREIPKLLEQSDKNAWIAQRTETFQEILDNAAAIASQSQDQEVLAALQLVARNMGLRLGASAQVQRTDPRDAELTKLRKESEDRKSGEKKQAYDNFRQSVDGDYTESVISEIETDLKGALVKANIPDASEAVMKRMVKDVWDRLDQKMREQPDTQKRIRDAFQAANSSGRMGESDKRSILDFVLRKAKATRPAIMREVVNEWTKSIIGAQAKKTEKLQTVAAQTKDVGSGRGAPTPPAARPSNVPQKRMTEKDIFASIGR